MAVSEVDICNLALARVGQDVIVNLTDTGRSARLCNLLYEPSRDQLLRSYRWKFAIKRTELAASATAPDHGYTYSYPLPTDCLRVLSVSEEDPEFDPDLDPALWDIEDGELVTDKVAPLPIKYIARIEDTNQFDPCFIDALTAYMAYKLAPSLRESETDVIAALKSDFKEIMEGARYVNAIESRRMKRRYTRSSWVLGNEYY